MSDISSIGPAPGHGPAPGRNVASLNGTTKATPAHLRNGDVREPGQPNAPQADRIELSDHARLAERLGKEPEIRPELVAKIRKAIQDPKYLSDQKLNTALDRMIADVEENNTY